MPPRLSYKEQFKEGGEEADRGNDGKATSKSGIYSVKSTVMPQRSASEIGKIRSTVSKRVHAQNSHQYGDHQSSSWGTKKKKKISTTARK